MFFVVATCPPLSLENGEIMYTETPINGGYPVNTGATFRCHDAYRPTVYNNQICLDSGQWIGETPKCLLSNNSFMLSLFLKLHFLYYH